MAKVNIYDKTGQFIESHNISGSFLQWIKDTCPSYKDTARPPYSATLNGNAWPYDRHNSHLSDKDVIDVTIEPGWAAVPYIIALLAAAYSYYAASNIPNYEESREQGASVYSVNARANSVSPSGFIREMAGNITIFPDLICLPRRKYIDNEEWLFLNMAISRGYVDMQEQFIYVSETPIISYEGDYSLNIAEPGDDISMIEAAENWFQSEEVLDLELKTAQGLIGGDWSVDYDGDTITSYLNGSATEFPFGAGEVFEITGGTYPGIYQVVSISGADSEIATVVESEFSGTDLSRLASIAQQATVSRTVVSRFSRRGSVTTSGTSRRSINRRTITEDTGSPAFSSVLSETISRWEGINGGVNWEGPFLSVPEKELTDKIELDISFPQGLIQLDGDNNPEDRTVRIAIHWRDRGKTKWSREVLDITQSTFDEYAFTHVIDLPSPITPEIRFRRVTKDSDKIEIQDLVRIRRVKSKLETPSSYTDVMTMQLALRGTNALATSAENRINIRGATRKLPTLQEIEDAANGSPYDLSAANTVQQTPWDVRNSIYSTAQSFGGSESDFDQFSTKYGSISISIDGLNMIISIDLNLRFYTLTNAYDIRSSVYTGSVYTGSSIDGSHQSVRAVNSGVTVYSLNSTKSPTIQFISEFTLTDSYTPVVSSVQTTNIDPGSRPEITSSVTSLFVSDDGTKMWMLLLGDEVLQYSMSTAFDISTISYDSIAFDVSTELTDCRAIYFGDSGARMFILGGASGYVYSYTLSTPNDLSTASYDGYFTSKPGDLGGNLKDINVLQGHMLVSNTENLSPEPKESTDASMSVGKWIIPSVTDTRASRSAVRFAASAIYDAVGQDYNNLVDSDALSDLDTLLEGRQDYLDAEFVDETTLWEALKVMLAVGYSEPVIKEGFFTAVRTSTDSDFTNLYTPDVMLGEGLQIDQTFYDSSEPDGVDIEYFDTDTNTMELVEYRLPGDLGLKPKRIQSVGITDSDKAWRYAARERRRLRVKPNVFTFTTELDALNSNYGDPIGVASDVFGGEYGHVLDVDSSTITVDFDLTIAFPAYAAFRKVDGTQSELFQIAAGTNPNEFELVSPSTLGFAHVTDQDLEPTLVTVGAFSDFVQRAIVKRISPDGENQVQVTAEEYVESIYSDDDNLPS